MPKSKHILLISYVFPPAPGIAGRRWAKFCKYLAKKNYIIHVITAKSTEFNKSEWFKDVNNNQIIIYDLPARYPSVLNKFPGSFREKVSYRLWTLFFKLYSKGVLFDRAVFWKSQLVKTAGEIIRNHNVKNVIVTIPPYKLAHHATFIKKVYQEINLIIDYRDPWSDNRSFHGFKNLSEKRMKHELQLENEVLTNADTIITVSEEMSQKLRDRKVTKPEKIITINNGFDTDDAVYNPDTLKKNSNTYHFVYAGSLYSNLDYLIEPLLKNLANLKQTNPTLYSKLKFDFYGKHDNELKNKMKASQLEAVSVHDQIPLAQVYAKMNESDACLLFSAPDHSFAFNTKFFEYLSSRKPILLFSNSGKTSQFLEENNLGYTITPQNFEEKFSDFLNNIELKLTSFNNQFDISPYSVKTLTNDLEALFVQ